MTKRRVPPPARVTNLGPLSEESIGTLKWLGFEPYAAPVDRLVGSAAPSVVLPFQPRPVHWRTHKPTGAPRVEPEPKRWSEKARVLFAACRLGVVRFAGGRWWLVNQQTGENGSALANRKEAFLAAVAHFDAVAQMRASAGEAAS